LGAFDCFQGEARWDSFDKWIASPKWDIEKELPSGISDESGDTCTVDPKDVCGAGVLVNKDGKVFMYRGCASNFLKYMVVIALENKGAQSGRRTSLSKGRSANAAGGHECSVSVNWLEKSDDGSKVAVVVLGCDLKSAMPKKGMRTVGRACVDKFAQIRTEVEAGGHTTDEVIECPDGVQGDPSSSSTVVINNVILIFAAASVLSSSSSSFWSRAFNMD